MKTLCLRTVTFLALGLVGFTARAQPYEVDSFSPRGSGPFFRMGLGAAVFQDGRLTGFGGPADSKVNYDVGFAADGAVGYAFNKYLAVDFEIGAVGTRIDSVPGFFSNDTFVDNVPFIVNLTLSLPIPHTLITPYVGAGAGGSLSVFNTDGFGNGSVAVFGGGSSDQTDFVFAWQAFAGVRVNLNPNMSLSVGYKYFTTEDTSFTYPPAFGGGPNFRLSFDGVKTHCVLVSFRCTF
jgi:opacity protein-like surface antigen